MWGRGRKAGSHPLNTGAVGRSAGVDVSPVLAGMPHVRGSSGLRSVRVSRRRHVSGEEAMKERVIGIAEAVSAASTVEAYGRLRIVGVAEVASPGSESASPKSDRNPPDQPFPMP